MKAERTVRGNPPERGILKVESAAIIRARVSRLPAIARARLFRRADEIVENYWSCVRPQEDSPATLPGGIIVETPSPRKLQEWFDLPSDSNLAG